NSLTYTPGTTVTYTVTVRNNGPSDVVGATVTDVLPAGTTGTWTAVVNNASVPMASGSGNISQSVNIQNGGSIVYTVIVSVPSGFTGDLVNTAEVTPPAGTDDPDPDNDKSTDTNTPA